MTDAVPTTAAPSKPHSRLYRLARAILICIAILLAALAVYLFTQVQWKYPSTARHGARQTGLHAESEIEYRLRSGVPTAGVTDDLPWDKILTDWHEREDVSFEGLQFADREVVGGKIHFRAVNDEGAFTFDCASGQVVPHSEE